ncbi:hypothetical protein F503_02240 [Ophiostoma piceae UAMH 11346]|uniref:Uncharacterized protein n=1 Tax=Ophiostoma piceae (strain UAMH 11346) TaxID=1262450 RepID=S3C1A5_OPHP1|nr:hypothetical protein F503_02240 [Ophiostoma piceae UAMH 11346]
MSWQQSDRPSRPSSRSSRGFLDSSNRPVATPAPDPFPPSQRYHDQDNGHQKRPAPRRAAEQEGVTGDAQKRRRLLLEMDDWTGAKAQKPLAMSFPRADPNAPAWGWSGDAEVDERLRPASKPRSASYSVKKFSPAKYSYPSSSSTMNARASHRARQSLGTPLHALRSSPNSQPVSGTLSVEERQRFEDDGVGILSPSGQTVTVGPGLLSSPMMSGALPAPAHLSESQQSVEIQQLSHQEGSQVSSLDRERTPSDVPDDVLLGSDSDSEGHCEEEEARGQEKELEGSEDDEGLSEEEAEEELGEECADGEPVVASEEELLKEAPHESLEDQSEEDIQLVPSDGLVETRREPRMTATELCPESPRPAPALVRDTSNLSEASRAAARFEAQRVTIREIPNCNDSDDPIEDSESELEMQRRASSARKTRGSRATGARARGTRTRSSTGRRGR